jgi:hypothetical protein
LYWFLILLVFIVLLAFKLLTKGKWIYALVPIIVSIILTFSITAIDYSMKTTDKEMWSGSVVDWDHKEEHEEWIPKRCTTNSEGKRRCSGGYYKHHNATNKIKTSDGGWIDVHQSPTGTKFNDRYPNDVDELVKFWALGTPSTSSHNYVNKVSASYSIFKHKDINLKLFPDLPKYPKKSHDYIYIDRILGDAPNKDEALMLLNLKNTELNKFIPDPDNPKKMKSWKQVNMIFVNVGNNKSEDYGFALQDYWQGGNKNDFVVSFSLDDEGSMLWAYPFSWSEVEILKLDVRDYMMDLKKIDDFVPVIDKVSDLVAEKFERKQFTDFSYLHIDISTGANIFIVIFNILIVFGSILLSFNANGKRSNNRSYRY